MHTFTSMKMFQYAEYRQAVQLKYLHQYELYRWR